MGRAIYSNLLNLGILEDVDEALRSVGEDLKQFEEVEDAALGNGGLGQACGVLSGERGLQEHRARRLRHPLPLRAVPPDL